jgi:acyl carrier protein
VVLSTETRFIEYEAAEEIRERIIKVVAENLGINKHALASDPALIKDSGLDSLDVVELIMELEEELDTPK